MGYIDTVLQPGERVIYRTRLSWTSYLPGILFLLLGFVPLVFAGILSGFAWIAYIVAGAIWLFGLLRLVMAWFANWTTEIAITDRRIVLKRGFIRRRTVEMHMDKVESVDVSQSILGRLLDYGDITVRGTGTGFEPIEGIDSPLKFRNHVTAR